MGYRYRLQLICGGRWKHPITITIQLYTTHDTLDEMMALCGIERAIRVRIYVLRHVMQPESANPAPVHICACALVYVCVLASRAPAILSEAITLMHFTGCTPFRSYRYVYIYMYVHYILSAFCGTRHAPVPTIQTQHHHKCTICVALSATKTRSWHLCTCRSIVHI